MKDIMKQRRYITVFFVAVSIFLAWVFVKTGAVSVLVNVFSPVPGLAAFLAGIGFSSLFTTAPAVVALGTVASSFGVWQTAFFGGAGALIGDLALLKAMTSVAKAVKKPIGKVIHSPRFVRLHRLREILSHGPFKLILWATGAIIIASPFPDELGLAIMGASKIPFWLLVCISYTFNTLGIAAIGAVASAL